MSEEVTSETTNRTGLTRVIPAALVAAGLIAFIVQNRDDVPVKWLFLEGTWPLWIVILFAAVAGAGLSEVLGWLIRRRRDD